MAKSKHVLHGALTAQREKNDPIIKAANVLESSNSYSRAGRMSESLLTGKDALLMSSNAQKNRQNKDKNKEEENSKSPDMRASWDVTRLRSVHKELSSTALSNSNSTNNNKLQRDDEEKDIENVKNMTNSEGSYSFKTVPRDSSKFRHFLGENVVNYNKLIENEKSGNESNEMEFQNLGPGHYQVRYDIIDHNPHAHTFLPKSSHKRRSKSQQESVNKEVESKEYVPFEKDSRCSEIQDHPKWYDKNRGPTSMFKSTSAIRELPRSNLVDQFYDNDQTKFSHPRPITAANFSKDITRAQASLVGRVGVYSAPDTYYDKCLNLNVTRPTLTKGMTFDQMRVSRDKQRRAGRHNISLIDYDVENNPKVNYPNWGHFYDVDEALLKKNLGDSRHKSIATTNHVRMDKQLGRSDFYGSRENSAGQVEQEGSDDMYPATSILSTNQAYDKTHQKLMFITYFDKMKKRPDYLYRIPDHNNLDYDAELTSVFPRSPNAIIMPEKPPKDTIQDELITEFYDQKYSIVHERPKAIDFSRNAKRNGQTTAKLMRSNATSLDMFYDVSRGLQYLEPRLQGDPMMKTQKGRVELYQTSKKKKKKKSLAQKKIDEFKKKRRQAVPKEFTDYIDINETMGCVKKKSIRDSYVDYARSVSKDANEFEKNQILRKRVNNKAVEPSCVTYTPIYSQVEPKPRNIFLGKPIANIP